MPRSNRPRNSRQGNQGNQGNHGDQGAQGDDGVDLTRALRGGSRIESKAGGLFTVQSVQYSASDKVYTCPACGLDIDASSPHIVAWRADGIMGAADDIAGRRHWHSHCWKIG